ncbi:hypothetical protein COOONC_01357 [Cooperia oncophora]
MTYMNYDLVLVTETWLSRITSSQYDVTCECDRLYKKGGGIVVLIKNYISFDIIFKDSLRDAYEIIVTDIFFDHCTIRLILVYRTPLCDSNDSSLLRENKLFVEEPTRGSSWLDLILCNDAQLVRDVEVIPPIGNSDHASVDFSLNLSSNSAASERWVERFPTEAKLTDAAIERYLSNIDWIGSFATADSLEEKYELFISILHYTMDMFAPLRKTRIARYKLPRYLERMISQRRKIWSCAVAEGSDRMWSKYKILDSRLNRRLLRYNAYLEKKVVESGDSTKLFTYINKRLNEPKKIPALRTSQSKIVILDEEKAEILAEHFQGIFAKEDDVFSHKDEIFDLLSKWPNSHSVTPDFIPLHLIKRTAHCLALPLELLFNLSYMRSEVPSRWRHSFIVPVPKSSLQQILPTYRPISVTSVFARLFEKKLSKVKVTTYLNRNSLIPINQHGFSTGKSTETALLTSFNDWTSALDSRKPIHVVYFDFAKAFDRVPHRKLTAKLESLGIYPLIVRWMNRSSICCNRNSTKVRN